MKETNDYLEKAFISRSWGLKKAELYLGIRACINTIKSNSNKMFINSKDKQNEIFPLIFTIESSISEQFNSEDFSSQYSYYHYGKDENILINLISDAAYKKRFDIFRNKNVIGGSNSTNN